MRGRQIVLVGVGVLAVAASVGVFAPASADDGRGAPRHGTVIRRTGHGIAHILARDYAGLGYGAGFAFAEDNGCLFADNMVTLSGQRSRWFGSSAVTVDGKNNLDSDFYYRQLNESHVVEELLKRPEPLGPSRQARDLMRGYANGYNRYRADHKGTRWPDPTCRDAAWLRPITELDMWRLAYQGTTQGGGAALDTLIAASAPPADAKVTTTPTMTTPTVAAPLSRAAGLGSNAIALGRTATLGHDGMVLANPHQPWRGMRRFYQQHLTIPGEMNVSGATLYGLPVVMIGHTDRLAWSHTWSTAQTFTLTQLTLVPGDPTSYLVDGTVRKMTQHRVRVPVRHTDGTVTTVSRTLYRTPDGPVLQLPGLLDWSERTAFVVHDANAGNLRAVDQWLAMNRSHSVADLRRAQARYQGLPIFTTVAADSTGAAYFGDVQVVPHVTDALHARCVPPNSEGLGPRPGTVDINGTVVTLLDGARSACHWGSDPDAVEPGLFGPGHLPSLTRDDHVSNSNDSHWLSNPAAPLTGYPAIVGDVDTPRSIRTRLTQNMIAGRLDGTDDLGRPRFTLPALQAMMLGNRDYSAELVRDAAVAMCRATPTLPASDGRLVAVRDACDTLAHWDLRAEIDRPGAVLWREYLTRVQASAGLDMWRTPFDPSHPLTTPRGLNTTHPAVRAALADTVRLFRTNHISLDITLGAAQRFESIPIHGCTEQEGCFNITQPAGAVGGDGAFPEVEYGSSFIMAVELTPHGPRSRTIMTYSQSANPASPFHLDQTRMYAAKQWVDERFTESEIMRDPDLTIRRLPH